MTNKVTGIGSLPHLNVQKAVSYSLKHSLPFLPQLTNLNEKMIQQALEHNNVEKNHSALYPFIEMLLENNISEFKIQVAGPSTANVTHIEILKTIDAFIAIFSKYKLCPIVFIDEPILKINNLELSKIFKSLKELELKSGIHTCTKVNLNELGTQNCNYFSYDTNLASGNIPDVSKLIIRGIDPDRNSLTDFNFDYLSYTCGLAKFSENDCDKILEKLRLKK